MHKQFLLFSLLFLQITLLAQMRLDVVGDARIVGKMEITRDAKIIGKVEITKSVRDSSLFIGADVGRYDTPAYNGFTSNRNTFVGTKAGRENIRGYYNTFLGYSAGTSNWAGSKNTFIGFSAGLNNSIGTANIYVGHRAGQNNFNGFRNIFVGDSTGVSTANSSHNIFVGALAGYNAYSGRNNTFIGHFSGQYVVSGRSNTFLGESTGITNTSGHLNTLIGTSAGYGIRYGGRNTFLGANTAVADISEHSYLTESIAIGYNAKVGCNRCAVIGGTGGDAVNVGIGTTTPTEKMHVESENDAAIKVVAADDHKSSLMLFGKTDSTGFEFEYDENYELLFLHQRNLADDNNGTLVSWDKSGFMFVLHDMQVDGDLQVNGTFVNSDRRFKKQIKKINQSLASLQRINGVSYGFRNKDFGARNFSSGRTLGLIAQEVEKVFPMLVKEDKEGYKAVNYDGFIPVLIEATKEQQQLINQQEQENTELKKVVNLQAKQLTNQQAQIDKLSSLVEKILEGQNKFPKTNNYTLPLLQKASLGQNQPNPFNQSTLIDYFLPENVQQASIQITALDGKILGQVDIDKTGKGQVDIQATTYPAGTYYYALIVDGALIETKKMVLMR